VPGVCRVGRDAWHFSRDLPAGVVPAGGFCFSLDKLLGITYNTSVNKPRIIIDTNVLVAALRSRRGASHKLLMLLGSEKFATSVSVPLVLEYEDAAKRLIGSAAWSERGIDDILDYICAVADHQKVYYLWRPFLRDADDDMVLEVAVAAGCDFIVTYNKADFRHVEHFGLRVVTAKEFLEEIGALP
jgi:putative PIN family toxin of toxin-antitoxin system